mmetsp:Transcript_81792/g.231540  ORF Transcript_81792/g.231540 Transcript_81792/m.231540 type:complete len:221 (-) Transcript_81792:110-772(-)
MRSRPQPIPANTASTSMTQKVIAAARAGTRWCSRCWRSAGGLAKYAAAAPAHRARAQGSQPQQQQQAQPMPYANQLHSMARRSATSRDSSNCGSGAAGQVCATTAAWPAGCTGAYSTVTTAPGSIRSCTATCMHWPSGVVNRTGWPGSQPCRIATCTRLLGGAVAWGWWTASTRGGGGDTLACAACGDGSCAAATSIASGAETSGSAKACGAKAAKVPSG